MIFMIALIAIALEILQSCSVAWASEDRQLVIAVAVIASRVARRVSRAGDIKENPRRAA